MWEIQSIFEKYTFKTYIKNNTLKKYILKKKQHMKNTSNGSKPLTKVTHLFADVLCGK